MSVHAALEAAFPADSFAPARFDDTVFCDFADFGLLQPEMQRLIASSETAVAALEGYRVVSGHFSLRTLSRIAPASAVSTVLREPRARLLSLYAYWRLGSFEEWRPYTAYEHARRPLAAFLAEPEIAAATDNQVCRLILAGDSRIPRDRFIASDDLDGLARESVARLDDLGFVALQERPDEMWQGLSATFDTPLTPVLVNETEARADAPIWPLGDVLLAEETLDLLERRTAADRAVYQRFAERCCGDAHEGERLADVAFIRQLIRLGRATALPTISELEGRLAASVREPSATEAGGDALPPAPHRRRASLKARVSQKWRQVQEGRL